MLENGVPVGELELEIVVGVRNHEKHSIGPSLVAKSADCLRQTMSFQFCWSLVQLSVGVAEGSQDLVVGGAVVLDYLFVSALLLRTLV